VIAAERVGAFILPFVERCWNWMLWPVQNRPQAPGVLGVSRRRERFTLSEHVLGLVRASGERCCGRWKRERGWRRFVARWGSARRLTLSGS